LAGSNKNIHSGHRKRIRKRFAETELDGFSPHETLELLLFYVIPRANTNEIAHNLIQKFKTVYKVFQADVDELTEIPGISKKSAEFIKLYGELCVYYLNSESMNEKICDPEDYVNKYFSEIQCEIFLVISLGADMTVKGIHTFTPEVFMDEDKIIRNLAVMTLKNQSCQIIIAHKCENDELPVPHMRDFSIVKIVSENLKALGIKIFDYIISNGNVSFSMYNKGAFSFDT